MPSAILWKERVVLNVVNESVEGGVGVVTRVAVAVIVAIVCRGGEKNALKGQWQQLRQLHIQRGHHDKRAHTTRTCRRSLRYAAFTY